ncbi:MAG: sortase [Patescibacteria group bacterium]
MGNINLTEDDLLKIFTDKKKPEEKMMSFVNIVNKFFIFLIILCSVYIFTNFYAFKEKFTFWYKTDFASSEVTDNEKAAQNIDINTASQNSNTNALNTDVPAVTEPAVPLVDENEILIPTINVRAPIIWRVENQPKIVAANLEKGVIQVDGTALPGEKGNIYITGHSSNFIWAKGSYNNIFALLNKVVVGDLVYIKFKNTVYTYKVYNQKVVLPTDLTVMDPNGNSKLTLVTCWPVGTSLKRLAIEAKQIYPDPAKNQLTQEENDIKKLPGGR